MHSYGLYDGWDRDSRELPALVKITDEIETALDIEFGYILRIRNARNSKITFRIEHPPFMDSSGHPAPPFEVLGEKLRTVIEAPESMNMSPTEYMVPGG